MSCLILETHERFEQVSSVVFLNFFVWAVCISWFAGAIAMISMVGQSCIEHAHAKPTQHVVQVFQHVGISKKKRQNQGSPPLTRGL